MDQTSPWIIEGTEQNFDQAVLQKSQELPVIVDFWATWCGPCQELGPVLEQLAREYAGRFLLVKVDVDQQPGIAAAFQVRSIPHVFALRNGQLVDQFMGALPEEQIRQWLDQFQPTPAELLVQEARKLEGDDSAEAEAKYREALELTPQDDRIRIDLARLLLKQHKNADCRALIEHLAARGFLEPEAENIKAELDVRDAAAEAGGVAECRAALAAKPDDLALQLKLAEALGAAQQYQEALDLCLAVVGRAAGETREEARTTMVNLFHMLGPEAELTRFYRRKLATALY
ncbi:MAG TPA: thioredoxin [Planctomycetaceae bacterium]|jgi:putative thioredoxin|nr:thioredoxin [Planctomycetaceae bacterium]